MATLVEKYKAPFTAEEIDEIWTQWVLAGTSWQNFQGPAQVMKSVKDANGNWLYSEGCIDPELADAGEPDDPDGVPQQRRGSKTKRESHVDAFFHDPRRAQPAGGADRAADRAHPRSLAPATDRDRPRPRRNKHGPGPLRAAGPRAVLPAGNGASSRQRRFRSCATFVYRHAMPLRRRRVQVSSQDLHRQRLQQWVALQMTVLSVRR